MKVLGLVTSLFYRPVPKITFDATPVASGKCAAFIALKLGELVVYLYRMQPRSEFNSVPIRW
jgi:hypothetical protein